MDTIPPLALRFACPFSGPDGYRSDGFLGAWSPGRSLHVDHERCDPSRAACLSGSNWFLCSAVASISAGVRPKIHIDRSNDRGLAFRGYIVDPPLHHFAAPADLWNYWRDGGGSYPNGVFAMALIDGRRNRLILKTDAFGFSPLYYRLRDGLVLFGTKPDFLVTEDCEPDPVAISTVTARGYAIGDRTLFRDIRRCPFGAALRFDNSATPIHETWFSADDLPAPERPLDTQAVARIEDAFTQAVRRCTALDYGEAHLPLTSGHDSRRILGTLLQDGTPFRSTTVRVFRNGGRDLDAPYAAQLAERFGFEHTIVELPPPDEYAQDDAQRRFELCAETPMHDGWIPSLMRALPAEPTTMLDGFLGDVLSVPGYRLPDADFFDDPQADFERIAEDVARTPLRRHVAPPFRSEAAVREELGRYLEPIAARPNMAELAYMLLRQRRATALWSQQMIPPEHLVACPYTDLDYMRTVMALRPRDRCASPVQQTCLERFHPELAAIAGSRDIPSDALPVGREGNRQRARACLRRLLDEFEPGRDGKALRERLTPVGLGVATAGRVMPRAVARWNWMLRPVFEALLHDRRVPAVWGSPIDGPDNGGLRPSADASFRAAGQDADDRRP